jgi:PAS domain S-box-containing protein
MLMPLIKKAAKFNDLLFESNPNPMWIYDLESFKFLAVNDAAIYVYGYTREEFLNLTIKDIRPEADVDYLIKNINTRRDQYHWTGGWRHRTKKGKIIDVEVLSHEINYYGNRARIVAVNDVTERKKAEEALIEAEKRYRNTLDNMKEGFQILSDKWVYLYVNQAAAAHGKTTREKLLNHTIMEVYPGIEKTEMFGVLKKCLLERRVEHIENEFTYPDGSKRLFELDIEPVPDGLLILSRDVTQEKIYQTEILRLNRVYSLLSNINKAIVRLKDKQILFDTVCKIAIEEGKFKKAWIGLFNDDYKSIDIISLEGAVKNTVINRGTVQTQKLFRESALNKMISDRTTLIYNDLSKAGGLTKFWYTDLNDNNFQSLTIFPIKPFNKVKGVITLVSGEKEFFQKNEIELLNEMVEDIAFCLETLETEDQRVKAENDLKESERKFFNAFEYASIGMALVDLNGNFFRVNNELCSILGYSKEELLKINFREITHPDDVGSDANQFNRMLAGEKITFSAEKRYYHKDGHAIWATVNSSLLHDKNEKPVYFITHIQDITVKKRVEFEIIAAKEKAEEMNRLKNNFLANMSHELRTPMIGILGAADVFRESESIEEIKEFIPNFEQSALRLLRTLDHILDVSKIEAEKPTVRKRILNIDEIFGELTSQYKKEALQKKLNFELDIMAKGIAVDVDLDLFIHIINNLLHNAIKFTSAGTVQIQINKMSIENSNYAQIIISDTGIGIPEDKYELIFEPFRQASEGLARSYEGTGLGLTLVKKYTEMMGGKITVESKLGHGSRFILEFPLADPIPRIRNKTMKPDKVNTELSAPALPPIKLLYIDDDKIAHKFIERFLAEICRVESCLSAQEALNLINKNQYDIILSDINLGSGMSGSDLLPRIKELEDYKNVPVIAITGYAMIGDKEKFLKQGFDYYIPKPIGKSELNSVIRKIIMTITNDN